MEITIHYKNRNIVVNKLKNYQFNKLMIFHQETRNH